MLTRRTVLAASVTAAIGAVPLRSRAQTLKKTLHIIVGFPAGGATDVIARILAERLRGRYAPSVIIENKPGGDSIVAIQAFLPPWVVTQVPLDAKEASPGSAGGMLLLISCHVIPSVVRRSGKTPLTESLCAIPRFGVQNAKPS